VVGGIYFIDIINLITNYGFPIAITVYLIYKMEYILNRIMKQNENLSIRIANEIKEMTNAITLLRIDLAKK